MEEYERVSREAAEAQERLAEEQTRALRHAAEVQRRALQDAAEQQRRTIAEAWRIQAQEKIKRALELYEAGLYGEAATLCKDAVAQDPSSFYGYVAAAQCHVKVNSMDAKAYAGKVVQLLRTARYSTDPGAHCTALHVLISTGGPPDATALFLDILRVNRFDWSGEFAGLLERLVGVIGKEYAGKIVQLLRTPEYSANLLAHCVVLRVLVTAGKPPDGTALFCDVLRSNGTRFQKSSDEFAELIEGLLNEGFREEALALVDSHKLEMLRLTAYYLEGEVRGGRAVDDGVVEKMLASKDASYRHAADREVKWVQRSRVISDLVKRLMCQALVKRYSEWKPEIEKEIREKASKEAGSPVVGSARRLSFGRAYIAWFAGISLALLAVTSIAEPSWTSGYHVFNALLGGLMLGVVPAIPTFVMVNRIRRYKAVKATIKAEEFRRLESERRLVATWTGNSST
jgi:hypothetical protein